MKFPFAHIPAALACLLLSGCVAAKVVTVPVKAAAAMIGGTADAID